jgi:flagellar biosynthesis chaperone FliJ
MNKFQEILSKDNSKVSQEDIQFTVDDAVDTLDIRLKQMGQTKRNYLKKINSGIESGMNVGSWIDEVKDTKIQLATLNAEIKMLEEIRGEYFTELK